MLIHNIFYILNNISIAKLGSTSKLKAVLGEKLKAEVLEPFLGNEFIELTVSHLTSFYSNCLTNTSLHTC